MKYKDIIDCKIPYNQLLISRQEFNGILISFNDCDMNLMNSTLLPPNDCPISMTEGTCSYEFWRGRFESLCKEDLEADDWYYYLV